MLKKVSAVLFMILFLVPVVARTEQNNDQLFAKANELYKQEKFKGALTLYQQIRESGFVSGELEYNIGNAYAKLSNYPYALLSYERALFYLPTDSDIKHNRDYIASLLDVDTQENVSLARKTMKFFFGFLNSRTLFLFIGVVNLLFFVLLAIKVYLRKEIRSLIIIFVFSILVLSVSELLIRESRIARQAMVVSEKAEVFYEPRENATLYFSIPAGQKVKMLKKEDMWWKISVNDNKKGWIKAEKIEPVMI